jgi:hypothetical protein
MKKLLLALALALTNLTLQSASQNPFDLPADIENAVAAVVAAAETEHNLFNDVPDAVAQAVQEDYKKRGETQLACKYCNKMICLKDLKSHVQKCGKKKDKEKKQQQTAAASSYSHPLVLQNSPQPLPPLLPTPILPPLLPTPESAALTAATAAQGAQKVNRPNLDFFKQQADERRFATQEAARKRKAGHQAGSEKTKKEKF